jgi:hypothetical protein
VRTTTDFSPSDNGRGSDAWAWSWTRVRIDLRTLGYCRVTFDHPPAVDRVIADDRLDDEVDRIACLAFPR